MVVVVVGMMMMVVVEGLWRPVMFRFRFRFHRHPHHLCPGFLLLPLLLVLPLLPLLLLLPLPLQDEKSVPPTLSNPSSTANPPDCTTRHLAAVFSSPLLSSCGVCYSVSELPWAHPWVSTTFSSRAVGRSGRLARGIPPSRRRRVFSSFCFVLFCFEFLLLLGGDGGRGEWGPRGDGAVSSQHRTGLPFSFSLLFSNKIQYPLPGVWLFGINLRPVNSFLPWSLIAIVEDTLQSNKNTKDQHNSNLVRAAALCDRWHGLAPSLFSLWGWRGPVFSFMSCSCREKNKKEKEEKEGSFGEETKLDITQE